MGIVLGELVENSLAQSIIIFDQNIFMFFYKTNSTSIFCINFLSYLQTNQKSNNERKIMTKAFTPNIKSKRGKDLTKYVANFVYKTKFKSIPKEVVELAKKHILDGFGLALSGSVARTGNYLFAHIKKFKLKEKQLL